MNLLKNEKGSKYRGLINSDKEYQYKKLKRLMIFTWILKSMFTKAEKHQSKTKRIITKTKRIFRVT